EILQEFVWKWISLNPNYPSIGYDEECIILSTRDSTPFVIRADSMIMNKSRVRRLRIRMRR
ncbi:hypothetical protein LINPERHAP1_LOCUS10672, partial [Linum perenne]